MAQAINKAVEDTQMNEAKNPEFSYFVNVNDVPAREKKFKLEASSEECDALSKRFDLVSIRDFHAHLVMKNEGRSRGITMVGKLNAVVIQVIGQQSEGQEHVVDDTINIRFLPEERITPELDEENLMTLDSEDLEPMPEDRFDLGELMAQYLALSVDPYLSDDFRLSQAEPMPGVSFNEPELKKPNPFAVLSDLKDKLEKE